METYSQRLLATLQGAMELFNSDTLETEVTTVLESMATETPSQNTFRAVEMLTAGLSRSEMIMPEYDRGLHIAAAVVSARDNVARAQVQPGKNGVKRLIVTLKR